VYTANSRIDDREVGHAALKLSNKLVEHYPAAAILVVHVIPFRSVLYRVLLGEFVSVSFVLGLLPK
jgi:hypothetical protein